MNVERAQPGPERSRRAYEAQQRAAIDASRALVRAARDNLSSAALRRLEEARQEAAAEAARAETRESRRDAVDLSPAARAADEPSAAEREARVSELAEAHRMDRLHTPERIARAAQRLLEGS